MRNNRVHISIKIPKTIVDWIDTNIADGVYCDRTDAIVQSLWYQMNKTQLQRELKSDIVSEVTETLLSNLYSQENEEYFKQIFNKYEKEKWKSRFKEK